MAMRCPNCNTNTLKEFNVTDQPVRVDLCSRCKGLWLDAGEIEALEPAAAKDLGAPWGAGKSGRLCPHCDRAMVGFKYPQTYVVIELCPACKGLWLDAGELKEIRAVRESHQRSGRLEMFAPPAGLKGVLIGFINSAIEGLT